MCALYNFYFIYARIILVLLSLILEQRETGLDFLLRIMGYDIAVIKRIL